MPSDFQASAEKEVLPSTLGAQIRRWPHLPQKTEANQIIKLMQYFTICDKKILATEL